MIRDNSDLLKTLERLKKSANKLKDEADRKEMLEEAESISFYHEFETCLEELKEQKSTNKPLIKRKAQDRTVDIIDKVSFEDLIRKYKYDFQKFFRFKIANPKASAHIKNSVLKILEKHSDIDEDQKAAMEEFCKSVEERTNDQFQCDLCDERPMTKQQIDLHRIARHQEFERTCCGKVFGTYTNYNSHVRKCHDSYQCEFCDARLLSKAEKMKHKKNVHYKEEKTKMFTCPFCGKTFNDNGNHRRHIRQVHTDIKHCKCDQCGRAFSDAGNLKRHIKTKHEGVRQQCPQCSQTVVFGTLQRHIRYAHKKETYQCPDCEKDFRSKYGLSSHVNEKHKAVPTEYKCEICGEGGFLSPQSKIKHKRSKHPVEVAAREKVNKIPHFECSYCNEKFAKRIERDRHQNAAHQDNNSVKFKCECGAQALTEKRLQSHKEMYCRIRNIV